MAEAARFYKIALADIVVFHDELELAPAKVRVKIGGGNAGHNGLRSITAHVGNDYKRVRIGVGIPATRNWCRRYVLSDFAKSERPWVEALCERHGRQCRALGRGQGFELPEQGPSAMEAKGFGDGKDAD